MLIDAEYFKHSSAKWGWGTSPWFFVFPGFPAIEEVQVETKYFNFKSLKWQTWTLWSFAVAVQATHCPLSRVLWPKRCLGNCFCAVFTNMILYRPFFSSSTALFTQANQLLAITLLPMLWYGWVSQINVVVVPSNGLTCSLWTIMSFHS